MSKVSVSSLAVCLLTAAVLAQVPEGFPGSEPDVYGFGPLGASGVPIAKDEAQQLGLGKTAGLRVTEVHAGPGQQAGLQVGDVIYATSLGELKRERDPTESAIVQLTQALEAVEAKKKGKLQIVVKRGGKDVGLTLDPAYVGKHSRQCPSKCEKCEALTTQSLQALAAMQEPDGSFPMKMGGSGGKAVVASLCGLAFLSSGSTPRDGPYQDNIEKAKEYVVRAVGAGSPFSRTSESGANWNQENWEFSYAPWFLCEYYRHRPTTAMKQRLQEMADRLIANMEQSGGWAHGPGGPNALDYLELEIMSNYALTALGCMRNVGIEVPQEALDKARDYVLGCTNGSGGVCYSDRPGQFPHGEAGRTAGAYLAFARCGYQVNPIHEKMGKFIMQSANLKSIATGHVSPVMHFLAGAMATWEMGPKTWQTYWSTYRTLWRSFRQPDGIFAALPTEETQQLRSNSDRGNGPAWITASYVLIMGIARDNLPVLLPAKKKGKPVEIVIGDPEDEAVITGDGEEGDAPEDDGEQPPAGDGGDDRVPPQPGPDD